VSQCINHDNNNEYFTAQSEYLLGLTRYRQHTCACNSTEWLTCVTYFKWWKSCASGDGRNGRW